RQWWRRFVLHDGQGSIGREQRQRRHHHRDAGRWPGQFRDYERGAQPHLCDSGGQVVHHRADLVVSVPGREWQLSDHVLRCDVVDSRRLQDWYHVVRGEKAMPRYKVRDGSVLPHEGTLFEAGAIVELPRHIGEDSIVRSLVQEVDETGAPVVLVDAEADERYLERFRPHERIT